MIDWNASAELNKCTIRELKAYFRRFNQSNKKVVRVCGGCGKEQNMRFCDVRDVCNSCSAVINLPSNIGRKHTKKAIANMCAAQDGHGVSEETCLKISKTLTGRKCAPFAEDHKQKLRDVLNTNRNTRGRKLPHSEETKQKLRIIRTGTKMSAESSRKKSKAMRGIPRGPHTTERVQHISAAKQCIPYDEWEDFAKEKKYCPKFTQACRESNREKYDRECFICGKSEKANGQKLSVHHVDTDKAQGCDSRWKLVPLCKHCHATAHNDEIIARLGYMVKDS